MELSSLQKKQQKSIWYFSRKRAQGNTSEASDFSSRQIPVGLFSSPPFQKMTLAFKVTLPRFLSPSMPSSSSNFTTPSPRPIAFSLCMPRNRLTSVSSPGSVSDSADHDTVAVSSDEDEHSADCLFSQHCRTDVTGYDPVFITSDNEQLSSSQVSPGSIMSSTQQHFW